MNFIFETRKVNSFILKETKEPTANEEWSTTGNSGSKPEIPVTGIHISPSSSPVPGVVPSSGLRSRAPQVNSGWL